MIHRPQFLYETFVILFLWFVLNFSPGVRMLWHIFECQTQSTFPLIALILRVFPA